MSVFLTRTILLLLATSFAHAYDWKHDLEGYVTRCFQQNSIKAVCSDLSDPDRGIMKRAELEIAATDFNGKKFWYGYMKGIEGDLCNRHLNKINHLLHKANQACITGWGEMLTDSETTAHWDSLETKFGKVSW